MIRVFVFAAIGCMIGLWVGANWHAKTLGMFVFPGPNTAIIGAIIGWKIGAYWELKHRPDRDLFRADANALLSIILAMGGVTWMTCIWGWVWIQPKGTFHDQGGMYITLFVLPTTVMLWLAAGPIALLAGRNAVTRKAEWSRSRIYRGLGWIGYSIGAVTTISGLTFVAWCIFAIIFGW